MIVDYLVPIVLLIAGAILTKTGTIVDVGTILLGVAIGWLANMAIHAALHVWRTW